MSRTLQAGAARIEITPPLTIPYLGYEPRHAFFRGVHDPLYARALAVDDGTTQAIVIAADAIGFSNDLLGPGRHFTQEVRQRVEQRSGVPGQHVMLAASHAHSTPETLNLRRLLDTPAAAPWLEVLLDQLASAAVIAMERRRPSVVKVGRGEVRGLAVNRRVYGTDGRLYQFTQPPSPDLVADRGAEDPEVGVLLFQAIAGDASIVVTNFACHPVTMQVQPLISADFPGAAMRLVEDTIPGCLSSLFLQGACGDLNPIRGDTRDFADVWRYGLMLGSEALKLVGQLSAPDYPTGPPVVAVASEMVALPGRELPPREPYRRAFDEAARRLAQAASAEERARFAHEQRIAEEALIQIDRGGGPFPSEVQAIRIGDAALVAIPGEPFVELGLEIKRRSVAPFTFVVGYANDYQGYLATAKAWQQGGYEVGHGPWSRVGPEASALVVDKALALIERLWR